MQVIWSPRRKSTCGSVGVCTAHVEKLFMQEYHPTLEKVISAKLMEDLTVHIMAQTPTVIYQPSSKHNAITALWNTLPAHPYLPWHNHGEWAKTIYGVFKVKWEVLLNSSLSRGIKQCFHFPWNCCNLKVQLHMCPKTFLKLIHNPYDFTLLTGYTVFRRCEISIMTNHICSSHPL